MSLLLEESGVGEIPVLDGQNQGPCLSFRRPLKPLKVYAFKKYVEMGAYIYIYAHTHIYTHIYIYVFKE